MLDKIAELSNFFGSDEEMVIAGGGNTSYKDDEYLWIKASGTTLATIKPEGFVKMDRKALQEMFTKTYSTDSDTREAEVLADLLAARAKGEYTKRPSVETCLHEIIKYKYVVHLHPTIVNALSCAVDGERTASLMFGDGVLWIPCTEPGWILASTVKKYIDAYVEKHASQPDKIILQNHGIFIGADNEDLIKIQYRIVLNQINARITNKVDFSEVEYDRAKAAIIAPEIRMLLRSGESSVVTFRTNAQIMKAVASESAFAPYSKGYTPDHMVYCNSVFAFIPACDDLEEQMDLIQTGIEKHRICYGYYPHIIAVQGLGVYAHGNSKSAAEIAMKLFFDNMKIVTYADSFGGSQFPTPQLTKFIDNWEAEKFRRSVANKGAKKRLSEKIIIVTGSAQGFGLGIAQTLLENGAKVVIADLNKELADQVSADFNDRFGADSTISVKVDVGDEESVKNLFEETSLTYGGLDIFVNNAGIAKAGSLEEMTQRTFELVTKVNYTAYYLGAKYASRIMKIQNRYCPDYYADIVQVNSKSGLEGSNKNFAYAGSKFGGIGLTQSFALELVPYNIKVNSVCPGNYFDGPLWSDPEKGLFVQYLNAGKVPGAKNVDDVKKYYYGKIPMARGCMPEDVARAIMYCAEQKYETGQAIPVTGGQVMLN